MELLNGFGGDSGFGTSFIPRNDDSFSGVIDLTSVFGAQGLTFFGQTYESLVINNNGNVTFGTSGMSTFTPFGMQTVSNRPMIAAFFADVDTRSTATVTPTPGGNSAGSNLVWYHLDNTGNGALTITWDDVGYFSSQTDKLNAFQMRLIGTGQGSFDIEFRYEDINWTTGSASGGVNGLGGTIARAGFTAGDGVNYFELGQSGNQEQMLDLELTNGNTGLAGYYYFSTSSGGSSNDVLHGDMSDNVLFGGAGNDLIYGYGGNDNLDGGTGTDTLVGGEGDDLYIIRDTMDVITEYADEGNDTVQANISVSLANLPNVENVVLIGNTAINATGNAANNVLTGNAGNNILDGRAGTDTASYANASAAVTVSLSIAGEQNTVGAGSDTLISIENLTGSIFNDTLTGNAGRNILNGMAGADTMTGLGGNDVYFVDNVGDVVIEELAGGKDAVKASVSFTLSNNVEDLYLLGSDNLNGTGNALANVIFGNTGNNILNGAAGNDYLNGGAGNDRLLGGAGNDRLLGGEGNDILRGDGGNDFLDGGAGIDWAYYDNAASAVTVNLALATAQVTGGAGSDTLVNIENLLGGNFADRLTGNAANNVLRGGGGNDTLAGGGGNDNLQGEAGNDVLNGGAGNDILNGGAGNDRLIGGAGKDQLTGGLGADIFVFTALTDSVGGDNRDVITDFTRAQSDRIDLSAIDANASLAGVQAFTFIGTNAFSVNATGQLRFDVATNTLLASVNADASAEFSIKLTGVTSVEAGDLILVA